MPDAAPAPRDPQVHAAEEDWEEISLDVAAELESHSELTAEAVDLDAFVLELHNEHEPATVETAPAVDALASIVETSAPLEVSATFEVSASHEVAAPFEVDAPVDAPSEVSAPLEFSGSVEQDFAATMFDAPALDALAPPASGLDLDDFAAALEQVNTPDATAFEPDPQPEPVAALPAEPEPMPQPARAPHTGWQDVLSAIRRDIGHLRGDDEPPTPPRPKSGYSLEPLVFPRSVEQTPAPVDHLEPIESVEHVDEPAPLEDVLASLEPAEAPGRSVDLASVDAPSVDLPSVDLSPVDLPSVDLPIEAVAVSEPPPAIEAYDSLPLAIPQPPKPRASKSKKKRRHEQSKPAVVSVHVDEWGFFDPQKVGFGALLSKLNEITDREQRAALPRY